MTIHLVEVRFPAAALYQLPHQEHCEGEFRESEQSILDFGIAGQDGVPRTNRIEINGIEELEE